MAAVNLDPDPILITLIVRLPFQMPCLNAL